MATSHRHPATLKACRRTLNTVLSVSLSAWHFIVSLSPFPIHDVPRLIITAILLRQHTTLPSLELCCRHFHLSAIDTSYLCMWLSRTYITVSSSNGSVTPHTQTWNLGECFRVVHEVKAFLVSRVDEWFKRIARQLALLKSRNTFDKCCAITPSRRGVRALELGSRNPRTT